MSCGLGACGRRDLTDAEPGTVHGSKLPLRVVELRRDRFHCYLCYILPLLFRAIVRCDVWLEDEQCRLRAGHRPPCRSETREGKTVNATRDGQAKKKRRDPTFTPRRRVGPHR